jgi:hypothetical protein
MNRNILLNTAPTQKRKVQLKYNFVDFRATKATISPTLQMLADYDIR